MQWSWSCYFGLGLKNLILFTSLVGTWNTVMGTGFKKVAGRLFFATAGTAIAALQ